MFERGPVLKHRSPAFWGMLLLERPRNFTTSNFVVLKSQPRPPFLEDDEGSEVQRGFSPSPEGGGSLRHPNFKVFLLFEVLRLRRTFVRFGAFVCLCSSATLPRQRTHNDRGRAGEGRKRHNGKFLFGKPAL